MISKDAKLAKDGRLFNYLEACMKRVKESEVVVDTSVDQLIMDQIVKNPSMNASTFYNLLKSLGIKFDKPAVESSVNTEADSSSSQPQAVRAKEGAVKLKGNLDLKTRSLIFAEGADKPKDGFVGFVKFGSILIKEGMGNFGDKYYYSKAALKSAVSVFEGKKAYADHPSATDEYSRPERSVRDVFGYFTNLKYQETDGRGELYAELEVLPDKPFDWARSLMTAAVRYSEKYPDKDFVGLSINASGDAQPVDIQKLIEASTSEEITAKLLTAKQNGIETLNVVNKIDDAISCDLVTEAGAGGRINELMESEKMDKEKVEKKEADAIEKKEGAIPADDGSASQDGEHDDEAQDIELIKKMIAKYMGDDSEATPEECGVVKEAFEACKEMGCKPEEAEEKAVHQLKLAKHMASKKEAADAEEKPEPKDDKADSEAKPEDKKAVDPKESKDDGKKPEDKAVEASKVKESAVTLQAENAALKLKLSQYDIKNHIEKVCKESGLLTPVTKKFREAVVGVTSVSEVDKTWKTFKKAYDAINEQVVVHNFSESIAMNGEKVVSTVGVDFADSLKN